MGLSHISIFEGYAQQLLAQSATPTDRENAEYKFNGAGGLDDGDWYYDTDTNTLMIYIGGRWQMLNFTSTL